MEQGQTVCCIGSVLWDVIGRRDGDMVAYEDRPGRITRLPGGVALNVAMALQGHGLQPILLSAVGLDVEGRALTEACTEKGLVCDHLIRPDALPTDHYMAIEVKNEVLAAIADAHTLEAVGSDILTPLRDGTLGSAAAPWTGLVALDGNLTVGLLSEIAHDPCFAEADLRVAPASPGKAQRLLPLLEHPGVTFYVNLTEARLILDAAPATAPEAAEALHAAGATRAVVTDGARRAAFADHSGVISAQPPAVTVTQVTGAGDCFMAAHIAADLHGQSPAAALDAAIAAAASHVSGGSL